MLEMAAPLAELVRYDNSQLDRMLPALARDNCAHTAFRNELSTRSRRVTLRQGDARNLEFLANESAHLVLTSPPYWTLKEYDSAIGQLGDVEDYSAFLAELDKVWQEAYRVLVPGGRLVVVVGDVAVARRANAGRHKVYPLHADIQSRCFSAGWENLTPILWHKISSARFEATGRAGTFFGKPFQPGAIIKSDVEYILIFRKPGNRSPTPEQRVLSLLSCQEHQQWFRQVWTDVPGTSRRDHPAPFPEELARRLIRMFSFSGDLVVDPFVGSGTTIVAAAACGRDAVGVDVSEAYLQIARKRLLGLTNVTVR